MKNINFTSRTKARKRAVDILFEADQKDMCDSTASILSLLSQRKVISPASSPLPMFAEQIVVGVAENIHKIDDTIATYLVNHEFERIASVDRAILRVAVWEILFEDELDDIIAIDEAIVIAKAISTENSPDFLNGILDTISKSEKIL